MTLSCKRNVFGYSGSDPTPVACLTRFKGRHHRKFPKALPFAYVFWKNFKNSYQGGGEVLAFSLLHPPPPPLNAPLSSAMKKKKWRNLGGRELGKRVTTIDSLKIKSNLPNVESCGSLVSCFWLRELNRHGKQSRAWARTLACSGTFSSFNLE